MNLATYSNTVIVPCFSSRNSRAFACLSVDEKYLPMKSSWNSPHVIASMSLEALTKSHHIWDSPSSWNVANLIFVASEVISMASNISLICQNQWSATIGSPPPMNVGGWCVLNLWRLLDPPCPPAVLASAKVATVLPIASMKACW